MSKTVRFPEDDWSPRHDQDSGIGSTSTDQNIRGRAEYNQGRPRQSAKPYNVLEDLERYREKYRIADAAANRLNVEKQELIQDKRDLKGQVEQLLRDNHLLAEQNKGLLNENAYLQQRVHDLDASADYLMSGGSGESSTGSSGLKRSKSKSKRDRAAEKVAEKEDEDLEVRLRDRLNGPSTKSSSGHHRSSSGQHKKSGSRRASMSSNRPYIEEAPRDPTRPPLSRIETHHYYTTAPPQMGSPHTLTSRPKKSSPRSSTISDSETPRYTGDYIKYPLPPDVSHKSR
ncbi:hypothetical protein BX600DRAFT_431542 [Xylariales sp. PMI_506]|nr:hypothetical protein BX600DRAFT_431542 [Xylariales sp. PMI_506]